VVRIFERVIDEARRAERRREADATGSAPALDQSGT
jgi:hypothetical protein